MVRNLVVLGGSSHPTLVQTICNHLGIPVAKMLLSKFSVGETRVEIGESVRGKDVYIIQSGSGCVNDNLMELLITISACKTASAKKVTAVLPLFPYSRQSDIPYGKAGAPLTKASNCYNKPDFPYTLETAPQTPHPDHAPSAGLTNGVEHLEQSLSSVQVDENAQPSKTYTPNGVHHHHNGTDLTQSRGSEGGQGSSAAAPSAADKGKESGSKSGVFQPQPGYKQWVAQAGTLVADLLTCAGADHIVTLDLHDAQYQGFFDIPVDNLYGRPLLKRYIQYQVPDYKNAVIVSPDAGGAKRATAIAESLGMPFALIHKVRGSDMGQLLCNCSSVLKERRPTKITDRQNATMMLVGDVAGRTAILIDDLADTSNTITRAARLVKKEGATSVIALITHGILSGEAIDRINKSDLDKVVVTNSVPQEEHKKRCPKLEVLDIGPVFAEVTILHPNTQPLPLELADPNPFPSPGNPPCPPRREHQRSVSV